MVWVIWHWLTVTTLAINHCRSSSKPQLDHDENCGVSDVDDEDDDKDVDEKVLFLSDPGKPGVQSLGPDVRPSL